MENFFEMEITKLRFIYFITTNVLKKNKLVEKAYAFPSCIHQQKSSGQTFRNPKNRSFAYNVFPAHCQVL